MPCTANFPIFGRLTAAVPCAQTRLQVAVPGSWLEGVNPDRHEICQSDSAARVN